MRDGNGRNVHVATDHYRSRPLVDYDLCDRRLRHLKLADLRDNPMAELDGQTVEEALTNLQVGIGQSLASAKADREAAEAQERTFGSIRESTRGVNLDEELADLMSFQRGFQAAGRVVQVADEMMETVLGMI